MTSRTSGAAPWWGPAAGAAVAAAMAACSTPIASPSMSPSSPPRSELPAETASPASPLVDIGPATCRSEALGIAIEVPDDWFYTRSGSTACQFMNPDPFEMAANEPAGRAAIEIRLIEGDVGTTDGILSREELQLDGRPAVRWELRVAGGDVLPRGTLITQYVIQLGPLPETGPNILAQTMSLSPAYESNRETLDDVMKTIVLPGG